MPAFISALIVTSQGSSATMLYSVHNFQGPNFRLRVIHGLDHVSIDIVSMRYTYSLSPSVYTPVERTSASERPLQDTYQVISGANTWYLCTMISILTLHSVLTCILYCSRLSCDKYWDDNQKSDVHLLILPRMLLLIITWAFELPVHHLSFIICGLRACALFFFLKKIFG